MLFTDYLFALPYFLKLKVWVRAALLAGTILYRTYYLRDVCLRKSHREAFWGESKIQL